MGAFTEWLVAGVGLGRRAKGGAPRTRPLPVRHETLLESGSTRDLQEIEKRLQVAMAECNLVAPATSCNSLPPGGEVSFSIVHINAITRDMYRMGDKYGLPKQVLELIGSDMSWDPHQTRRLDDGSDPHYVHYRAVGSIRRFDGTQRTLVDDREVDLRPGSSTLDEIVAHSSDQLSAEQEIRYQRKHILSCAATLARLRVIRQLGVKSGYTVQDLARPFAIVRLVWTGKTGDPELDREIALMYARQQMGATAHAYGPPDATPVPLAAADQHAPPPVGSTASDQDQAYPECQPFPGEG